MAELSESDRQEARRLAADALMEDEPTGDARVAVAAVDPGDVKDFFCKHWDQIKKVLEFLAKAIGGIPGRVLKAIIVAGDFLHGRICRG